jgi:hypothetical protein
MPDLTLRQLQLQGNLELRPANSVQVCNLSTGFWTQPWMAHGHAVSSDDQDDGAASDADGLGN